MIKVTFQWTDVVEGTRWPLPITFPSNLFRGVATHSKSADRQDSKDVSIYTYYDTDYYNSYVFIPDIGPYAGGSYVIVLGI